MAKRETETRYDRYGPLRLMTRAEGYVMFRRPHAIPYCMTEKEWQELPLLEKDASNVFAFKRVRVPRDGL